MVHVDESHRRGIGDEPSVLIFGEYQASLRTLGEHRGETFAKMMTGEITPDVENISEHQCKEFAQMT